MPTRDPLSRLTQNLLTVRRLGNTIATETEPLWQELFDQIVADLMRIDPTAPGAARWKRYRTEQFVAEVEKLIRERVGEWRGSIRTPLAQAGRQQGRWTESLLVFSLGEADMVRPTPITQARIRAILNTDPFHGRPLDEWASTLERATRDRVVQEIRLGMVNEESIPQLVRRIRGEQRGWIRKDPQTGQFVPRGATGAIVRPRYVGGVLSATSRDAEAIVRTAVNHVSNVAQMETYAENARLLSGVQFSATLDISTTFICASLDGTVWPLGSSEIQQPPLHIRCRSGMVPVIDWDGVGLTAPDEGLRAARRIEVDEAGNVTPRQTVRVRSGTVFERWIKDQPARVQDEYFGPARARLFRAGRIKSLKELVDTDGRVIPLDQLAA